MAAGEELRTASVLLAFLAGLVATVFFYDEARRRWERYLAKYAARLKQNLDFTFHVIEERQARRFLTLCVLGGFALGFLATFNLFVGMYMAGFGFALPLIAIKILHQRRIEAFDEQLMDVVTLMSNSLKSGLGLQQAMELVVKEMKPPASQEFGLVLKEIRVGASVEEALQRLNERLKLAELDMVVTSVATLRQTGGNMTETFDTIAYVIKERRKVEGKIRALTAQGKMQMNILCAMPYVLMGIMWLMDSTYVSPLYQTALGWVMLTLLTVLVIIGWLVIRKIITIEV